MMEKTNLRPLSKKEMAQIVGGEWVNINGKFYWLPVVKEEDSYRNAIFLVE